MAKTPRPTREQFAAYQSMYDYFNKALFAGELPPVLLNFSRHAHSYGFFAPMRWARSDGAGERMTHEISINPSHLALRPARETASTLVHEMCHLWEQELGDPPRTGYHSRAWAEKMRSVGLITVDPNTGAEKYSAHKLTHRIEEGGRFDVAFEAMPAEYVLPWTSAELPARDRKTRAVGVRVAAGAAAAGEVPAGRVGESEDEDEGDGEEERGAEEHGESEAKSRNKVKYTCPGCLTNVWGRPELNICCGDCNEAFAMAV